MRPGSMPRSKSSRYTSTSLRVFPVPALAHTTVLVSNGMLFLLFASLQRGAFQNRRGTAATVDFITACELCNILGRAINRHTSCTTVDIRNRYSPVFRLDQDAVCLHEPSGSKLPFSSAHHR